MFKHNLDVHWQTIVPYRCSLIAEFFAVPGVGVLVGLTGDVRAMWKWRRTWGPGSGIWFQFDKTWGLRQYKYVVLIV